METLNNQSTRAEIFDAHVRSQARAPFLPALAACTLAILGGIDASESELRQTAALSAEIPAEGRYGFSKELIESDVRALALQMQVAYQGLPPANTHSAAVEAPPAKALLVVRTSIPGLDVRKLNQLAEQVAASINRTDFKLVTLSDANVTSAEAKSGSAAQGGLLDFNENQSVAHAAAARGLGLVLFVDLMHFNAKASTIPGAAKIHILNARASLTLLNAEDGVRVAGASREVSARGADPENLRDKGFELLARDLAAEMHVWKIPAAQPKLVELEVHAQMDGIVFPVMDVSSENGNITVSDIPVFAQDASVEIDGVLKGRAPCRIGVAPGTHKLKVYRDGTNPFTATIQVIEPGRYDALLVPSPEFRRHFDEQMGKFQRIKTLALEKKAELEAAGVRTDALRVENANARDAGRAQAGAVRSRASGEAALAGADAEMKKAQAEATRKGAEGQLAIDKSTASHMSAILKARNEMLQTQLEAFRSFAEKLGDTAFRIGLPVRQ